ncbi:hypothetical protein V1505DRAFT_375488 [Lipomyces doorenjongii]
MATQCDVLPGGCTNCAKVNCPCPGYRNRNDLIFRNETQNVMRKVEARAAKSTSRVNRTDTQGKFHSADLFRNGSSPLSLVGSDFDPFRTLPLVPSSSIDVRLALAHAMLTMEMAGFSRLWINTLINHPVTAQSVICTAAINMHRTSSPNMDDSALTVIRTAALSTLKGQLEDPVLQAADETIMAVLQLLTAAMFTGDSDTLEVHARGIEKMVQVRGGLARLGLGGEVAFVVTGEVLLYYIWSQCQPPSAYLGFANSYMTNVLLDDAPIAESPLYFPYGKYTTISRVAHGLTLEILCDMRDLTEAFFRVTYENGDGNRVFPQQTEGAPDSFHRTSHADYHTWAAKIYDRALFRPSAAAAGITISNDWTYECIRLTAIIYTTALVYRIPFSVAGTISTDETNLVHSLVDAIKKADDGNWAALPGCLLWVILVGSAASGMLTREAQGRIADHSLLSSFMFMLHRTMLIAKRRHEEAFMAALLAMLGIQRHLAATNTVAPSEQ